jgi:hypothetical protein
VCWRGSVSCTDISVVCPGELRRRNMKEATSASCPVLCRFRSFSRVCLRSTGVAVTVEFLGDHSFLTWSKICPDFMETECYHNISLLVLLLSQMNPVHTMLLRVLKINFNIISPIHVSQLICFPSGFRTEILETFSSPPFVPCVWPINFFMCSKL